jgi:hypothetical protein
VSFIIVLLICVFVIMPLFNKLFNAWDKRKADRWYRAELERDATEWKREEEAEKAEWNAFRNWVKQNPQTADRLMAAVEHEQISDPDYRAWIAERRAAKGPDMLTDLPRLFNWLKAQRDLRKFGLSHDLPMQGE